jgi:D-alanyl-D-alanine carboxypeptidase/D-alanyl-D-alanine-endopeptidase (penicillin-binding protein 4)
MAKSPSAASFRNSLPIAGRDGTLRGRLMPIAGRVSAKTGYLTYTHALSGYVITTNGEELAFSIICNDATGQSRAGRTIDAIVTLLTQYGSQKSVK